MDFFGSIEFNKLIWVVIALLEVVVRLTPSQKDNSILNKIIWVVEKILPNKSSDKNDSEKFKLFKKNKK
jgi:hypothetical protein|tara:strand:- start:621 stop:827 length:207 start_codon:yes stop_codon:yes gene_type:complete